MNKKELLDTCQMRFPKWKHRRAPEGTWVPGGGIEIPCTYFFYGAKIHKRYVRKAIKECEIKLIS